MLTDDYDYQLNVTIFRTLKTFLSLSFIRWNNFFYSSSDFLSFMWLHLGIGLEIVLNCLSGLLIVPATFQRINANLVFSSAGLLRDGNHPATKTRETKLEKEGGVWHFLPTLFWNITRHLTFQLQ